MEMEKIILPRIITRKFIQDHPDWIFVYGASNDGKGFFGQTYHCQGEPNAYSVSTMFRICNSASDKYFDDSMYDFYVRCILDSVSRIPIDGRPILPLRRIGEGHSQLSYKAPKLFRRLMDELDRIKYPNIVWDYNNQYF